MCGIFAVSGSVKEAGSIVLRGLKKLEYRGYDSWGVAVRPLGQEGCILTRQVGKISSVDCPFAPSKEAIGHTRWATHGGVSEENSHPHKFGRVVLVHNGIFENYLETKKHFQAQGKVFYSQTDTEVIPCLIDDFLSQGMSPLEALRSTADKMEGRFSILFFIEGVEGIFAARRGSPLIIGRTPEATFLASDIPALLEHTSVVNYLDDEEAVHIVGGKPLYYNLKTLDRIEKRDITVSWKAEEVEKGSYKHFMIKEIFDQKQTIYQAIDHDDESLKRAVELLKSSNGSYFIACGTAHKMALAGEYFFSEIAGRKINVVPASEMPSFERFINSKTAVVAVSQSGETTDVMEILERSKAKGAKILALTNVESSSMARIADVHLPINAGPERAVASTKASTAQMALLLLLAFADADKINYGRELLSSTASAINDLLNPRYQDYIENVAQTILHHKSLFIIGRNSLYPIALESAIKIQEVSYIHAQGFAAGEIKHGPIALIESGVPCLVLGDDPLTISNAIELKARGALIIGIAPTRAEVFDEWLRVPDCDGAQCIASLVPVQILAYALANLKGLDPDMPRNLAKSVTVK